MLGLTLERLIRGSWHTVNLTFLFGDNMILKTLGTAMLAAGLLTSAALVQAETVRWARSADVTTLDPHVFNTGTNFVLMHQMYETLVNRTNDGKLVPLLATEWKLLRR